MVEQQQSPQIFNYRRQQIQLSITEAVGRTLAKIGVREDLIELVVLIVTLQVVIVVKQQEAVLDNRRVWRQESKNSITVPKIVIIIAVEMQKQLPPLIRQLLIVAIQPQQHQRQLVIMSVEQYHLPIRQPLAEMDCCIAAMGVVCAPLLRSWTSRALRQPTRPSISSMTAY